MEFAGTYRSRSSGVRNSDVAALLAGAVSWLGRCTGGGASCVVHHSAAYLSICRIKDPWMLKTVQKQGGLVWVSEYCFEISIIGPLR